MVRICFVCLGNICRSPTAEAVFQHLVDQAELSGSFEIDSAGTSGYHVGELADSRSRKTARSRGFELTSTSRQVKKSDFDRFDHLIAMDRANQRALLSMAPNADAKAKVSLFRDYDPASPKGSEVPDPYYGGDHGFDNVFDICEAAGRGLLAHLRQKHSL